MIANLDPHTSERLETLRGELPAAAPILDLLMTDPEPFSLGGGSNGPEFSALRPVQGRPNRAVIKLFRIADGPLVGRIALFFYKKSQIPFSRDRHSYGAAVLPERDPDAAELRSWVQFAGGGFDPQARPPKLRLALTFTVPD
jgi:hypothetical protein